MKSLSMKALLACVIAMGLALTASTGWATQIVRIGAAQFPPYVIDPEKGVGEGLLPQVTDALNRLQNDYQFVLVPTSLARRFQDFEQGRVDMAFFENPEWGWQTIDHSTVDLGLEDAEVFVARNEGRDQAYFADLNDKRLALFNGYHYAFAGFDANPQYLLRRFNATLTYSHDSNLAMILRGRADIALVTRSYVRHFLSTNADLASQLMVSERIDQRYHHYALLRPKAPIDARAFHALLEQLRADGQLAAIFSPYQIAVLPTAPDSLLVQTPAAAPATGQ